MPDVFIDNVKHPQVSSRRFSPIQAGAFVDSFCMSARSENSRKIPKTGTEHSILSK